MSTGNESLFDDAAQSAAPHLVTPERTVRAPSRERCRHCKTPLAPKQAPDGLNYNAVTCRCCVTWLDVEPDDG